MLELLKSRRSIRKYKDKEVEKEKLDTILKSALVSPTSRNKRCWEFIAVTDKDMLSSLSQCKAQFAGFIADAPLAIVVAGDKEMTDIWIEDASIASTNIMNVVHALGLGSCWVQFRDRFNGDVSAEDKTKELLDMPEKYGILCVISIGYPNEERPAYTDADLPYDKLHMGKFGQKYSL